MKKTLCLFLFIFSFLSVNTQAENFKFTSYYPAPTGNYQSIHFIPQSELQTNPCNLGTLYANADKNSLPYFCAPNAVDIPTFSPIAGPWTLSGNDLYLTDTTSPLNKKVGIGTITPTFKLTIENDGGILADGAADTSSALPVSGAGTRLMWYPAKGAFRAGYVSAAQWDDANIGTNSLAMGYNNTAASQGASVWGGQNNSANGGASPFSPVITGGLNNTTTSELAQILGGSGNSAGKSARVFGKNNASNGDYSMIGGGENNISSGNYSTISGGYQNNVSRLASTISGGSTNTSQTDYNTISGGLRNAIAINADTSYSTITGGHLNRSTGSLYTVIGGGYFNIIGTFSNYATISGGNRNSISGGFPLGNTSDYCTISGGNLNNSIASIGYCTIGGGSNNTAGNYASVVGGYTNQSSGDHAIIPGGKNNTAAGAYSLAAGQFMDIGQYMTSNGSHSFVWGYAASAIARITTSDAMIIYSGSMGIRDTTPAALLEINGNGSTDDYLNLTSTDAASVGNILTIKNNGFIGVKHSAPIYPLQFGNGAYVDATGNFMPASSHKYKENIIDLNLTQALDTLNKLNPVLYNYKNETDHRYVGFIAEDVPDLVADQGRQGLAPMDIAAVLTKVIAHQHNLIEQQRNETDKLLEEFNELKNKAQLKNQSKSHLKNL